MAKLKTQKSLKSPLKNINLDNKANQANQANHIIKTTNNTGVDDDFKSLDSSSINVQKFKLNKEPLNLNKVMSESYFLRQFNKIKEKKEKPISPFYHNKIIDNSIDTRIVLNNVTKSKFKLKFLHTNGKKKMAKLVPIPPKQNKNILDNDDFYPKYETRVIKTEEDEGINSNVRNGEAQTIFKIR